MEASRAFRRGPGDLRVELAAAVESERLQERTVKIGTRKDGFRQILDGLQPGELVASEGAIFLSNMLVIGQAGG